MGLLPYRVPSILTPSSRTSLLVPTVAHGSQILAQPQSLTAWIIYGTPQLDMIMVCDGLRRRSWRARVRIARTSSKTTRGRRGVVHRRPMADVATVLVTSTRRSPHHRNRALPWSGLLQAGSHFLLAHDSMEADTGDDSSSTVSSPGMFPHAISNPSLTFEGKDFGYSLLSAVPSTGGPFVQEFFQPSGKLNQEESAEIANKVG